VLKHHEIPFTLGIATDAIEQHARRGALSWDQIREMVASGLCEVASHSVTHRAMTSLPDEVALRELSQSRSILEQALGQRPDAFFYPLGAQDRRIRRLTKRSGYRAAFVAQGGPTVVGTPRFGIPRYDVKPRFTMHTFRSFFNHEIRMLDARLDSVPDTRLWLARPPTRQRHLPKRAGDMAFIFASQND
jgi:peptidoglycan/xylan/chitin deacetylase (PgdA/CDA1 family)